MENAAKTSNATSTKMRDRQRILRNMVALISLGKAAVIGAGVMLAFVGYADLAEQVLPADTVALINAGLQLETAAGIGGLLGVIVGLVIGVLR